MGIIITAAKWQTCGHSPELSYQLESNKQAIPVVNEPVGLWFMVCHEEACSTLSTYYY